jgi:hypothetical protein
MSTFLSSVQGKLASLGRPIRFLILGALVLLTIVPAIWALNQVFVFLIARSYVDQLAVALDINKNLATAILWGTFAVAAFLAAMQFPSRGGGVARQMFQVIGPVLRSIPRP